MAVWLELKMDLKIVHHGFQPRRVKNPPERRGLETVFSGFSGISGQNAQRMALILAKMAKIGQF